MTNDITGRMLNIFWDLTDEEILQGMTIAYDKKLQNHKPPLPMTMFAYDTRLQRMGEMLRDSGFDRVLMKLKYADELAELVDDPNPMSWFAPAGLRRGIILP